MGKSTKAASSSRGKMTKDINKIVEESSSKVVVEEVATDHLPPIFLIFTVMACSGFLFVYSFRDVFATGRNIGGAYDHAYLVRIYGFSFLFHLSSLLNLYVRL
jgi:hypothetical protein